MIEKMNIFYAYGRPDSEVRLFCKKHGIEISDHVSGVKLIFIDVKGSERGELYAVKGKCRPGVTVYMIQISDLGHGAKAAKERREIEATGATIVVPDTKPQKRGPKPSHGLTDAQIKQFQPDYDSPNTRQFVCDKIFRVTSEDGNPVKVSIGQLNRIYKKT